MGCTRVNAADELGLDINIDGSLSVNTSSYETLVTADNDIPNKKYVDDAVEVENIWDRAGAAVSLKNAGDTVRFDATGGIQFGAGGQNIVEFSTDGTLAGDSDTALATEKAVKTYIDNVAQGLHWQKAVKDQEKIA